MIATIVVLVLAGYAIARIGLRAQRRTSGEGNNLGPNSYTIESAI
jgi:hypothetical protein